MKGGGSIDCPIGESRNNKTRTRRVSSEFLMVPGGGIEPPTRGFSISCMPILTKAHNIKQFQKQNVIEFSCHVQLCDFVSFYGLVSRQCPMGQLF